MAETVAQVATAEFDQGQSILTEEDRLRANTWSVLAALLSKPPTADVVDYLRHIELPADNNDEGEMGRAWRALHEAARDADLAALDAEYHRLFIGLGRGEVVPFGSWHITGFLMEKPLSDLRDDLRALGIESHKGEKDPEDHIAALCESMALIITAADVDESRERGFYARHIHPWAGKFFRELHDAASADFYRPVGLLGQRFVELENHYLNVQTH